MKIWDVHHHWVNETGYIDRLLRRMDDLGVERLGMIAMGPITQDLFVVHEPSGASTDDNDVAELIRQHGDRFWGYGYVRPGFSSPDDVDRLADMGVSGLKFTLTAKPYGEEEYFELYERASRHHLPCLFHTGVISFGKPMPGHGIRSENYRPIHLEPVAQQFPDLTLICAHLGVCWTEEAAALCRMFPNIYADLSGRNDGWRSGKSIDWFKEMLFWAGAHEKILFGSDVHADEMGDTLEDYLRILRGMGWSESQIADVLANNARRIFGAKS